VGKKNWKIKINEEKSTQVKFSQCKIPPPPPLKFKQTNSLHQSTKYLGITLDKKLTWSNHITKQKRKQLNTRLHLLRPLLKSNLSLKNK